MQRRVDPDAFVTSLPGGISLAPYLVDEVLNCQTPDIRDFLLRTSITDRVCPGLANILSDRADADILLPGLVDGNVLTEPWPRPRLVSISPSFRARSARPTPS